MPDVVYQPWRIHLIHLLPKFHNLAGEDPHKHLKEFHLVCSTMRLNKGLAIPTIVSFSHLGRYEAHVSGEVLLGVQNYDHPEGNIEQLLIQYFYECLMMMDQGMIDAASSGALMDKTPTIAR
ncbi:hypothetical protein CR513_57712, partial [Mucuna pruriens]